MKVLILKKEDWMRKEYGPGEGDGMGYDGIGIGKGKGSSQNFCINCTYELNINGLLTYEGLNDRYAL
jgi:hypothetical protein